MCRIRHHSSHLAKRSSWETPSGGPWQEILLPGTAGNLCNLCKAMLTWPHWLLLTREVLIKGVRPAKSYDLLTMSSEQHVPDIRHCINKTLRRQLPLSSKLVFDHGTVFYAHIRGNVGGPTSKVLHRWISVFVLVMSCMSPMWQGVILGEKR